MRKLLLFTTALALVAILPGYSTLPVIDYSVLTQSIQQGLRQIQQYTTELNQLETQIGMYKSQLLQATGLAPAAQIWQNAQQTLNSVTGTVNMFRSGGALEGYLQNARDANYWLSTSTSQYTSQSANYWSTTQQTANAEMAKEIAQEETQIQADAQTLQRLQSQAGSVATQRQALDVANEMSGLEQKSLLEIRTLLVSEQQALAARSGTVANKEAMQQAATQQYFGTQLAPQNHTGW
jgi:P-type conjugative transfer protein TrbJ